MKGRAKRTSPMLNERLIDDEAEAALPPAAAERARKALELERSIRRWGLERPAESPEERSLRRHRQRGADQLVFPVVGAIAAASLISCAFAMLTYSSGICELELLFALSITQGAIAIYQRLQVMAMRSRRDKIAVLWNETKLLKKSLDEKSSQIIFMQKDIAERQRSLSESIDKCGSGTEGYGYSEILDLYHENGRINMKKKLLAEAMGIQKLTRSILETDADGDHYVGNAELCLLAQRIGSIEGVPFESDELRDRFKERSKREEGARTLRNLADTVRILYFEKRREGKVAKASEGTDMSPMNICTPVLWNRKLDGIDITVC